MREGKHATVAGAWAYQGSRAAYGNGRIMNAQANRVNAIGSKQGDVAWTAEAIGQSIDASAQLFSPPALGKDNLYLCSVTGHVLALDQKTGASVFAYALKRPVAFQPALAGGNVYLGTTDGLVICLKTGLPDADGWHAWGRNAQHNKGE
jgi:outer membrane protein assembly factor BamB